MQNKSPFQILQEEISTLSAAICSMEAKLDKILLYLTPPEDKFAELVDVLKPDDVPGLIRALKNAGLWRESNKPQHNYQQSRPPQQAESTHVSTPVPEVEIPKVKKNKKEEK